MRVGWLPAAAAGAWAAYAWLPHVLTRGGLRRGSAARRRLALTFDDGPDPVWTPRVLEILARHSISASFFLVGERAARHPAVVRAIAGAGHEVGNHGWSHRSLWRCGPARTREEIERAHHALAGLTGAAPRYFRPPWGMMNAAMSGVLRDCGERAVFWSIQPEGLRPSPPARQVEHVLRRAQPGAIVDLHDAEGTSAAPARLCQALPSMIEGLRAAGFRMVTLSELLAPGV